MTTKSLRTHEAELNGILHDTVPGLAQGANENSAQYILSHVGADDRLLNAEHHRLLIRSDAFHVSILFQPTLFYPSPFNIHHPIPRSLPLPFPPTP